MRERMEMKNLRLRFNYFCSRVFVVLVLLFHLDDVILLYISLAQVHQLLPRRVKKRRKVQGEDGSDQGWEEYFDYIFPEDEAAKPNLKLLAMAKMWKKQKEAVPTEDAGEAERGEEEVEERIPISDTADSAEVDAENPDADDQDIVNESSDEDSEEDEKEEVDRKRARLK